MPIDWLPWEAAAFERARREKKPVLFFLAPFWSRASSLAWEALPSDAGFRKLTGGACVPVWAEAARRPDLASRYGDGNWPVLGVLTPEGDPVATSDASDPGAALASLRAAVERYLGDPAGVSRSLAEARRASARREAESPMQETLDADFSKRVLAALHAEYDPEHGGFGRRGKSPLPDSLELLLYAAREWKDKASREMLVRTLDAMAKGGLRDRADGGFFVRCLGRDWTKPLPDKVLMENARLAKVYLDAHLFTGSREYLRAAEETLGWVKLSLLDPDSGGFRSSQADAGAAPWAANRAFFVDANAVLVPTFLKAAVALESRREEFESDAIRVLSALETRFFDHHEGMFHYAEPGGRPREPGFLADQAWTMIAFTEAFQQFMDRAYRDFADELLRLTFRAQWYRDKGGFHSRASVAGEPGSPAEPDFPLLENAVALEAIWRLGEMKGIPNYARWLKMGLMNALPRLEGRPHEAAAYARLLDLALRGRQEFNLVGRPEDPRTRELLLELKRNYLPRAVVSFVHSDDMDFILSHRLEAPRFPRLFAIVNGRAAASGDGPEEIAKMLGA